MRSLFLLPFLAAMAVLGFAMQAAGQAADGVRRLVRGVANLMLAAGLSGLTALLVTLWAEHQGYAHDGLLGLLTLPVAFPLYTRWLFRRTARTERARKGRGRWTAPHLAAVPEPADDVPVSRAFDASARLFPKRRRELDALRAPCAHLLRLPSDDMLDPDYQESLLLVRRHIPELVAQTEALLPLSSEAERNERLDRLWASLESIAGRADAIVECVKRLRSDRLDAHHIRVQSAS